MIKQMEATREGFSRETSEDGASGEESVAICLAMQTYADSVQERFGFHFQRNDSKINRLDKVCFTFQYLCETFSL